MLLVVVIRRSPCLINAPIPSLNPKESEIKRRLITDKFGGSFHTVTFRVQLIFLIAFLITVLVRYFVALTVWENGEFIS